MICHAYCPACFRIAQKNRFFTIAYGVAIGNPAQHLPAPKLEGCAGRIKRKVEVVSFAGKVFVQFSGCCHEQRGFFWQGIIASGNSKVQCGKGTAFFFQCDCSKRSVVYKKTEHNLRLKQGCYPWQQLLSVSGSSEGKVAMLQRQYRSQQELHNAGAATCRWQGAHPEQTPSIRPPQCIQ